MKDSEKVRNLIAAADEKGNTVFQQQVLLTAACAEALAALLEWKEAE